MEWARARGASGPIRTLNPSSLWEWIAMNITRVLPLLLTATLLTGCGGAAAPHDGLIKAVSPQTGQADPKVSKVKTEEVQREDSTGGSVATDADTEAIEQFSAEIQARTAGLPGLAEQPAGAQPSCSTMCEIRDAICKSSSKICDISERRPSVGLFAERCQWSRAQCTDAEGRCTLCGE